MPLESPGGRFAPMCGQGGVMGLRGLRVRTFRSAKFFGRFTISGITRASDGTALGACDVMLFESATNLLVAETKSSGTGVYSFSLGNNAGTFYIVAYKAGSPDVAGTTVNTLTAT